MSAGADLIRVSGLKFRGPVGKRLERLADGSIAKTPLLGERTRAAAVINVAYATAAEMFAGRMAADAATLFFAGTYEAWIDDAIAVPNAMLADARAALGDSTDAPAIVSATKNFLEFRPGAGVLRIDIDVKRPGEVSAIWPEEPFRLASVDEVVAALDVVLPESRGCPTLVMPSSGSMIVDTETGEMVKGPGGWRVLIVVDDALQIARLLETIHRRCWARGEFCYAFINAVGSFLQRSLADQALARPTQPDYAVADLGPGLARAANSAGVFDEDGPWLAAASVVLSVEDEVRAASNIEAARLALAPSARRLRGQAIRTHADRLVKKGVPREAALHAATTRFEAGSLLGSDIIQFDDGSEIAAAVLLTQDGEAYDGRLCRDPAEPDYDHGRSVGRVYWNEALRPGVHSFAHGSKFWQVAHDVVTAATAIDEAGPNVEAIARALALAEVGGVERIQLEKRAARLLGLGAERKSLRASVEQHRQRVAEYTRDHGGTDNTAATASAGPSPLTVALPRSSFPRTETTETGLKVIDHPDNVGHMLDGYGIEYRYNVITKAIEWRHPNVHQGGDNAETVLLSQMIGLCALNKVPPITLSTHLTALAARREYNPVTDHLKALKWDGKPRFKALAAAMQADNAEVSKIVLRLFLLQACAAGDNAEIARGLNPEVRAHFEGCLVLVGVQGVGKTTGLRKLLPPVLRKYFKEGLTLALRDKDSITNVVSCWIAEMGELEGTFRKSEIAELKSFISRDVDQVRLPYARKTSSFARRTAFTGTVNDVSFLSDETGNRRFWPLTVGMLDVGWNDTDIEQLWAEAWLRYATGEKWWPSAEEEQLLAGNTERYRYKSALEEVIENYFQWGRRPDWKAGRHTASQIYATTVGSQHRIGIGPLTPVAMKTIGTAISRLWRESGIAETRNGVLTVPDKRGEPIRLNKDAGQNRGWLLPPVKTGFETRSGFALLDGGKVEEEADS